MKMFKHNFFKNKQGVALLEFAIILPALLLIFTATIEISNFAFMSQKNQTAAIVASHLFANLSSYQENDINNIAEISAKIFGNLIDDPLSDYGIVATFMQSNADDDIHSIHQVTYGNTGLVHSNIGFSRGEAESDIDGAFIGRNKVSAADINHYTFIDNEQIVIVETAIVYKPIITSLISEDLIASSTTISYKSEPTMMRIGRSNFLPDGGSSKP
jgi:hypothetical protein